MHSVRFSRSWFVACYDSLEPCSIRRQAGSHRNRIQHQLIMGSFLFIFPRPSCCSAFFLRRERLPSGCLSVFAYIGRRRPSSPHLHQGTRPAREARRHATPPAKPAQTGGMKAYSAGGARRALRKPGGSPRVHPPLPAERFSFTRFPLRAARRNDSCPKKKKAVELERDLPFFRNYRACARI